MLPEYFEFFCPVKILAGKKALANLPYELNLLDVKNPLVITDKGVVDAGLLKPVKDLLASAGLSEVAIFDDVPPDSSTDTVSEAASLFKESGCDGFIALGGGSSMDTAKAANILVSQNAPDLMQFEGADRITARLKPFVAIPTTAGTGSEVTIVSVIKDLKRDVKMAFTSQRLYPDIAVIDPEMTVTMPPHITASTGMDALTHAVEAYICLQKNPLSDAYATAAINLIRMNIAKAVADGSDMKARMAMACGATMAGIAFSNSMVGVVHSLGHATGAVCRIPHGTAMSIFLPEGLEYNLEKVGERIEDLLLHIGGEDEYTSTDPGMRARRTIFLIRRLKDFLYQTCGLPRSLREAGVDRNDFRKIATVAINDGSLTFNPEEMDLSDAMKLLEKAY